MAANDAVAVARGMIESGAPVHMSGIGGVGMAGLALLLQARGVPVSGCDLQSGPFAAGLSGAGIRVHTGHAASHVEAPIGWLIRSTAVRLHQPDVQRAAARSLPVLRRGEVLPALVGLAPQSVAVAGTHGKTTTASLVAQLLRPLQPSWCIGGVSVSFPLPGGVGGGPLVVEADESDGTLALYTPEIALVTNVDFDHMEHFDSVAAFEACFSAFMVQARGAVVYCADDPRALALAQATGRETLGYGFGDQSDVRGDWMGKDRLCVSFPGAGDVGIVIPASLPGRHNALNLLGALAVCHAMRVPPAIWADAIPSLSLPARRFEEVAVCRGIRIVSDYAHHPAEIAALVRMARDVHTGRILAVFQPHRYTRTAALGAQFPVAFSGVDELVLVPVYAASEDPLPGGTTQDLAAHFASLDMAFEPVLVDSLVAAATLLRAMVREGDLLLVIGAGDVEKIGKMVATMIRDLNAE